MGNPGIGESGNRGIQESGSPGIGESRNRAIRESDIRESGNPIPHFKDCLCQSLKRGIHPALQIPPKGPVIIYGRGGGGPIIRGGHRYK